jgi:hypothetical protein
VPSGVVAVDDTFESPCADSLSGMADTCMLLGVRAEDARLLLRLFVGGLRHRGESAHCAYGLLAMLLLALLLVLLLCTA